MLIDNEHDNATLTATSEALSINNTKDQRRGMIWESADTATQVITGTLTEFKTANVFSLARHNLSASGSIRLILKNQGLVSYDSGVVLLAAYIPAGTFQAGIDAFGATYNAKLPVNMSVINFDSVLFNEYEIHLSDSSNHDGFLQLGRIALGQAIKLEVNFEWNSTFEWLETAKHTRMSGGGLYTDDDPDSKARRFKFNVGWQSEAQRVELDTQLNRASGRDILIQAYPESGGPFEQLHTFMAKRTSKISFAHDRKDNFKLQVTMEEC